MKRACCHCIFAAKATLAFLAAAFSLGIQIYWVYNRIDLTKLRLPPVVINQKLCAFTSTTLSRIEPQNGKFLMGFSPQWEVDRPKAINDRLNRKAVLFNAFVKITDTDFMKDMITWHAQMVGEVGAILELTVDPGVPIQTIPDSMYLALATHIRFCNQQYGTPMILRFAHEMNVLVRFT